MFNNLYDFANAITGKKKEVLPDYSDHPDWHYPMSIHANPDLFPKPKIEPISNTYFDVNSLNISGLGIALIQHFESLRLVAYDDATGRTKVSRLYPLKGKPTIGWGTTVYPDGTPVKMGDVITEDEANRIFKLQLPDYEKLVRSIVTRKLNQYEFDALVSFSYNAGTGYLKDGRHTLYNLWKHVNEWKTSAFMVEYWQKLAITSGGKVMAGLVRRRKAESHLFTTGELNFYKN